MKYVVFFFALMFAGLTSHAQNPTSDVLVEAFIKASKIENDSSRSLSD